MKVIQASLGPGPAPQAQNLTKVQSTVINKEDELGLVLQYFNYFNCLYTSFLWPIFIIRIINSSFWIS